MSLQSVIAKWGAAYAVTRTVAGTYSNGVYTDGSQSTVNIVASIQPMSGDDLKSLAEGQHTEDTRVCFTETELKTRAAGFEPDRVPVDGKTFEVIRVEKWTADKWGTHYRCYLSKVT